MGLSGKLEVSVEIKSPGVVFFEIFGTKKGDLPKVVPHIIPHVELLEGQWGVPGCIILATFNIDGQALISKKTVEAVDKEKESITFNFLEGDIMKIFKTYKLTTQPIQEREGSFLKWTIVYEKFVDEDIQAFLDTFEKFINRYTNEIDAYYVQAQAQGHT